MIDQGKQSGAGSPTTPGTATGSASQDHKPDTLDAEKLKQQGRDTAHEVGEVVQEQAETYFIQQRDNAAEQSHKLTSVLQKTADEFDQQQQPFLSKQTRKLADTTERFANNLRDKDLRSVCDQAQSFSRREPALFVGGVIAAGFLVSRFLRSSGQHSSNQHADGAEDHASRLSSTALGSAGSTENTGSTGSTDRRSIPGSESL